MDAQKLEDTLTAILDGEVQILRSLDALRNEIKNIQIKVDNVCQRVDKMGHFVSDTYILSNNAVNGVDELHGELSSLSDKIEAVQSSVDNIRVYRNVSNFEP